MDTFMKSSPALSQTSEGEDGGEERERERGEDGVGEETYWWPLCVKRRRRHDAVCVVLTPLNGKNLDDAQRPLQAKLWSPAGDKFLMRREDSGAAPTLRERYGGRGKREIKSPVSALFTCSLSFPPSCSSLTPKQTFCLTTEIQSWMRNQRFCWSNRVN